MDNKYLEMKNYLLKNGYTHKELSNMSDMELEREYQNTLFKNTGGY